MFGPFFFVFIWYYKASGYFNILQLLPWMLSFLWGRFLLSFLCFSLFCKRCMFIYLSFLYWVYRVRGNISGGPGHMFPVCVTPLCGVLGRYKFYWALSWSGWRDCTSFSFLWLCCSGYGTVEMVRGLVRVSSCFLQFAVSSLGGRMSVVGLCVP